MPNSLYVFEYVSMFEICYKTTHLLHNRTFQTQKFNNNNTIINKDLPFVFNPKELCFNLVTPWETKINILLGWPK